MNEMGSKILYTCYQGLTTPALSVFPCSCFPSLPLLLSQSPLLCVCIFRAVAPPGLFSVSGILQTVCQRLTATASSAFSLVVLPGLNSLPAWMPLVMFPRMWRYLEKAAFLVVFSFSVVNRMERMVSLPARGLGIPLCVPPSLCPCARAWKTLQRRSALKLHIRDYVCLFCSQRKHWCEFSSVDADSGSVPSPYQRGQ